MAHSSSSKAASDESSRGRRRRRRNRSRIAGRGRGRARGGELVRRDRDRGRRGRRSGAPGPGSAAVAGVERLAVSPGDLESRCYLVPWDDGTVLVGATVEDAGFDERTTVAGVRDLLEAACEITPQARTASFVGARAGLRPGTRRRPADHRRVAGCAEPDVRDRSLSKRRAARAADRAARRRRDARRPRRPGAGRVSPARFGDCRCPT